MIQFQHRTTRQGYIFTMSLFPLSCILSGTEVKARSNLHGLDMRSIFFLKKVSWPVLLSYFGPTSYFMKEIKNLPNRVQHQQTDNVKKIYQGHRFTGAKKNHWNCANRSHNAQSGVKSIFWPSVSIHRFIRASPFCLPASLSPVSLPPACWHWGFGHRHLFYEFLNAYHCILQIS